MNINTRDMNFVKFNNQDMEWVKFNGIIVWEGWKTLTVQGVPPISLQKCANKNLIDYKIYGNSKQGELPDGYTQVEYIESTGTQYLSINYIPNLGDEIEFYAFPYVRGFSNDVQSLLSAGKGTYQLILLLSQADVNKVVYYKYFATGSAKQLPASNFINGWHNYKINSNGYISVDGTFVTDSRPIDSVDTNLFLFVRANMTSYSCTRMGKFTIVNNGVTMINLIPCYRKSDNVIGMYDTVNNVFYTNAGTGTFIAGEKMPNPDNPIEIQSVGDLVTDENDENYGKYKIPVKVNGNATNIYLNEPLRKGEDYADYIDFENKRVVRNIFEYSTSNLSSALITKANFTNLGTVRRICINLTPLGYPTLLKQNHGLCDSLRYFASYSNDTEHFYISGTSKQIYLFINETYIEEGTVESAVNYLTSNPILFYGVYETPQYEPIELPEIPTYTGTNIIEVDTAILPSNMEVKYKGKE